MADERRPAAIALLGLLALLALPPSPTSAMGAAAPPVIDDIVCSSSPSGGDFVIFNGPLGEIIRPRLGTITSVLVYVEFTALGGSIPLTLKIRRGSVSGPVVAEKTKNISVGGPRWEEFSFADPVEVEPGEPYFIGLESPGAVTWFTMDHDCPYADKIRRGSPATGSYANDYIFKTRGFKPDLDIALNTTEVSVRRGESAEVEVILTSIYRFQGEVRLLTSDMSDIGLDLSLSDPTPVVPAGGEERVPLTITASEDAELGDHEVSVEVTHSAFWGFFAKEVTLTVHVEEALRDFDVSISPGERTVEAGSEATFTVEVTPVGRFDQTVQLSVTGLPEGATYSFSRPSGVPPFSSTLTVSTGASTPEGSVMFTVTARSGAKAHVATAHLTIERTVEPDFSISVSPGSLTVAQGESADYTIEISPVGGFSDPITVSLEGLPPDATFSVTQTGAYSATLHVQTGEAVGSFILTVTASGGGKTHSASVTLTINPGAGTQTTAPPQSTSPPQGEFDFSVSISPESVAVSPGDTVTFTVTVQSTSGTPQPVSLAVSGLPSDCTHQLTPENLTPTGVATLEVGTGSTTGTFTVTITASGGGRVKTATATLTVQSTQQPIPSRCVIATAAYGSEMAPQVQMLREFRDDDVASTSAGSAFLRVFNAFYYSWSPPVAEFISKRPGVAAAVRATLYPLVGILSLSEDLVGAMGGPSELSITASGVLAASLLGLSYLLAPMVAALRLTRAKIHRRWLAAAGIAAGFSAAVLTAGVSLTAGSLAAAGSAGLVLSTLALAPMTVIWVGGLALSRKGRI